LIQWATQGPEGADYTANLPLQCLHPTGHWYEVPNMLRNGALLRLLRERPQLRHLMMHNIDTVGANLDAGLLGFHIDRDAAMTVEVIGRQVEDRGGGLARVNGLGRCGKDGCGAAAARRTHAELHHAEGCEKALGQRARGCLPRCAV
jgi:hypothetical protein